MNNSSKKPIEQRKTYQEIIGHPSNKEALKVAEQSKNLPHLKKQPVYILKN
jgi:hypothetical protein